jgi:hypothetical protein
MGPIGVRETSVTKYQFRKCSCQQTWQIPNGNVPVEDTSFAGWVLASFFSCSPRDQKNSVLNYTSIATFCIVFKLGFSKESYHITVANQKTKQIKVFFFYRLSCFHNCSSTSKCNSQRFIIWTCLYLCTMYVIWYDLRCLLTAFGFPLGNFYTNIIETTMYMRNNTHNNTKTQNTQNRKQDIQNKKINTS